MDYKNATIIVLSIGIVILYYFLEQSHKNFYKLYGISLELRDIIDRMRSEGDDEDDDWRNDPDDGRNWKPIQPNGGGSGFNELIIKNKEYLQKAEKVRINKLEIQER